MATVAKCAMHFAQGLTTDHEATAIVTFHFERADVIGPYSDTDLHRLAHQLVNWWDIGDTVEGSAEISGIRLDYSDETRLIAVEAYPLLPVPGTGIVRTVDLPIAGFSHDGPCPPQTAIQLSWRSGLDARRGRSRTFLPAPRSGMVDPSGKIVNCLSTSFPESAVQGVARWGRVLYRNVADSGGLTPNDRLCVFSRLDATPRLVVDVRARAHLRTQRERAIQVEEYATQDFDATP